MRLFGFTLIEQLIVITIMGMLCAVSIALMRPSDIKINTLKKAGKSVVVQLEFATKNILAKDTNNYTLTRMVDSTGEFSIASSSSTSRMVELFKKRLVTPRTWSIASNYKTKTLTDGTKTLTGTTPSSFSGFVLKNGSYFGIKLFGNCTTSIDYMYNPATPDIRDITNLCGLVFFDINSDSEPNVLGVDQYIVGLNKRGIK